MRIRVLAVPSGIPSASETSTCVRPPKNAISRADPLGLGQLGHRGPDGVSPHAPPRLLVHVVLSLLELEVDVGGVPADVRLPAHQVDGLVAREREEPGAQRAACRIETAGVLPDRDEDLLDNILGEPVAARDLVGERVERAGIPFVERLDGPFVLLADPDEEPCLLRPPVVGR